MQLFWHNVTRNAIKLENNGKSIFAVIARFIIHYQNYVSKLLTSKKLYFLLTLHLWLF